MKILLRAVATLFGGVAIVAILAVVFRPNDRGVLLGPAISFLLLAIAFWHWSSLHARQARAIALVKASNHLLQCECCDFFTIDEPKLAAICVVCAWRQTEDGFNKFDQPSAENEEITLKRARAAFLKSGASPLTKAIALLPVAERSRYRYAQRKL